MDDNLSTLVQCPSCGNIQDHSERCTKCGKDMASRSNHEETIVHDEGEMKVEDRDAPLAAGKSATNLMLAVQPDQGDSNASADDVSIEAAAPECPPSLDDRGSGRRFFPIPIYMPIGKLVALSAITFCIYQIFWFRRNWKILQEYYDNWIEPGVLTVKMLISVYGIFLAYRQFTDINKMVRQYAKGFPVISVLMVWAALFGWIVIAATLDTGFLLFSLWLSAVLPLIPVQFGTERLLTEYW